MKSIQLHDSIEGLSQKIVSITLHYITLHYITLHYITLHYITLHYITSHHITSHHITSHHITSHHITLHYITTTLPRPPPPPDMWFPPKAKSLELTLVDILFHHGLDGCFTTV